MDIFKNYLGKHGVYGSFIDEQPESNINNIIIIPSLAEPNLLNTVKSLWACQKPNKPVEIIVVINSSENAPEEIIEQNKISCLEVMEWVNNHNCRHIKLFSINIPDIPAKWAGAGFARKIGMDEAIRRFNWAENAEGIISSLDADALVAENYLIEVENLFIGNPKCNASSIYFEHPVSGLEFSDKIYQTIIEYELHLRYYKQVLKYIGFPYYHHTVGSSFAVKAMVYCKQGGMNKKQAGEDFYFLHKLMPLGNYSELNSTCVYPSPRPSNRVPFGTGATIRQFAIEEEKDFQTYHFNAFLPLKKLFSEKEFFYKSKSDITNALLIKSESVIQEFLKENDFLAAIEEINRNSASIETFNKRFFQWFDAFRLIKYLNFAHNGCFSKLSVNEAVYQYFKATGNNKYMNHHTIELLDLFRNFEKNLTQEI